MKTEYDLKNQQIATWLFIVLLGSSFFILSIYSSLQNVTQTITLKQPTLSSYNELYEKHSVLVCPCSSIAINQGEFITFRPTYHQVCQSYFVTDEWIKNVGYSYSIITITTNDDFQQMASVIFRLLKDLCDLTEKIVDNQITTFAATNFISINLVDKTTFLSQQNNVINVFKESTRNAFRRSFRLISNTTEGNTLLSGLLTNTKLVVNPLEHTSDGDTFNLVDSIEQTYNRTDGSECSCSKLENSEKDCFQQMAIYSSAFAFVDTYTQLDVYNTKDFLVSVPGIYIGCYIVPGLLFSDLHCFFDKDCLFSILQAIQLNENYIPTLNHSFPSRYLQNTTIGELVQNLLIEDWNNQSSYENYFSVCQPQICQYTITSHSTFTFIIITIIGLIGGLVKIYRFLIPLLVRFVRRYMLPFVRRKLHFDGNNIVTPI